MAKNKVDVTLGVDATDAEKSLKNLEQGVDNLDRRFGTMAGQVGLHMRGMAAEAAVSLATGFAGDVLGLTMTIGGLDQKVDDVFGESGTTRAALDSFVEESRKNFGEGDASVSAALADVAIALDLDGQNPEDLGMIQGAADLAAALHLDNPGQWDSATDALKDITTFLATGEAGVLEDSYGDFAAELDNVGERYEALKEVGGGALERLEDGTFENQQAVNEMKAEWETFKEDMARVLAPAVMESLKGIRWAAVQIGKAIRFLADDWEAFIEKAEAALTKIGEIKDAVLDFPPIKIAVEGLGKAAGAIDALYPGGGAVSDEFDRIFPDNPGASGQTERVGGSQGLVGDFGLGTEVTLHGREAIIPLNDPMAMDTLRGGGSGGVTVNVQVAPGGDLSEAGRQIVEAIRSYQRTSGLAGVGI